MATHTSLRGLFTAIANAIRAKTGESADIVADNFPTAIAAIPTGATLGEKSISQNGTYNASDDSLDGYSKVSVNVATGASVDDIAKATEPSGDIVLASTTTAIKSYALACRPAITSVRGNTVTVIGERGLWSCANLERVTFPEITYLTSYQLNGCTKLKGIYADSLPKVYEVSYQWLKNCSNVEFVVLPKGKSIAGWEALSGVGSKFEVLDFGGDANGAGKLGNDALKNNSNLATLVIRYPAVCTLQGTGCFTGTPFASGGTGGTIYIPKSLYDHLGDGTADDYKAATNWSTMDGYGTITWAQIEGSIYETQYADGTPIPTA